MTLAIKQGCEGRVSDRGGFFSHGCSRVALVIRDGKGYCNSHDPVAIAQRQAERTAKFEEDFVESNRKTNEREQAITALRNLLQRAEDQGFETYENITLIRVLLSD